jgi:tetratricopeptide (TPR) repeat protein/energy-coupling factor transporter ATP-binding protein EcfA2
MSGLTGNGLTNPFPGLRPFREEEEYLFFGRESQVDTIVDKLAAKRFLAVVGTSGSGKSSLVNCGLRPALRRGLMASAGSAWRMAQLRPGSDPIRALARALSQPGVTGLDAGAENLGDLIEATLSMSNLGVVDIFEQAKLSGRANLLLIVDQFEELFRYETSRAYVWGGEAYREASVAFVNLLLEAAKSDYSIYVVLAMRSDFLGDCARFPGLPEAVNEGQYLVPRLTREERRSAISGPIAVGGGAISPVLLTRLVNDVGDNPDQLSILQHALNRTWAEWQRTRRGNEPISSSHYEAIGTMAHALDQHAEKAFAELTSERQKKICEVVFQALTDKGTEARGIRRPTSFASLCAIANAGPSELASVLDVFRKPSRSFLMPPFQEPLEPQTTIDISHESLMRIWSRLKVWVENEAESAAQYRRLVQNALLHDKGSCGLMTDPELALMLEWQRTWQPTTPWAERYDSRFNQAMDFLDRSRKERDRLAAEKETARKRKLRQIQWVAGAMTLLAAISLFLATVARREKNRAETNLQLAKKAVDESLSSAGPQQAQGTGNLPEMEQFRKELLDKAASFYAVFAQQDSKSEGLRREVAAAHSRLGDINRLLDKRDEAVREYKAAISHYDAMVKDFPGNKDYRQALAYAHNFMGETLRTWCEELKGAAPCSLADAASEYDSALALQRRLHDEDPPNPSYQQELARTYYNRGILRYDSKDAEGAEADFRTAINLLEPLAANPAAVSASSTTPSPAQELARACNNLANLISHSKTEEAEKLYQDAISLAQALNKSQPDNRQYQLELAQYYDNLAILLTAVNQLDLAQARNHEAVHLIEGLTIPSPSLSVELVKSHQLGIEISKAKGSAVTQQESDRLFEKLKNLSARDHSAVHPVFHVIYMNLGVNYIELAESNLKSGDVKSAIAALDSLAQILPELSAEDRETLARSYPELQKEVERALPRPQAK